MRTKSLLLMLILTLILTACAGASTSTMEAPAASNPAAPYTAESGLQVMPTAGADQAMSSNVPASNRLVIKNANITVEVERVAEAEATLRVRAEQLGGYVVSVQTYGSDDEMISIITFRVPVERFDEALSGVESMAHRVLNRSVSGDDVTEEFVDLESRLRNLEATRERLLALLERAQRVEDALQVNQALSDVQGQIEQIQGRMKYLRDSAALSTISVELRPIPPQPDIVEEDSWQPVRVAREALSGLVSFAQALAYLGIVLLIWSPVWLPMILLTRWGLRRMGARRTANKSEPKENN